MRIKRLKLISYILLCIFILSCCDLKFTNVNDNALNFTFNTSEKVILSGEEANVTINSFCGSDSGIFYITLSKSILINDTNSLEIVSIKEKEILNKKQIFSSAVTSMNCLAIYAIPNENIILVNARINSQDTNESKYYFSEYTPDFEFISEIEIDKSIILEMGDIYSCNAIDGYYYFICKNGVYVFENEYKPMGFIELDVPSADKGFYEITNIDKASNGDIYIFCYGRFTNKLNGDFDKMIKINKETLKVEDEFNLDKNLQIYNYITGDDDFLFYGKNSEYLYGISSNGIATRVLSGVDFDKNSFANLGFGMMNNDSINYFYMNYNEQGGELFFVKLEKVYDTDETSIELTMTVAGVLRDEWKEAVKDFNKENDKYKIKIDIISYEDSAIDEYDTAIISNNVGDIIIPPENNEKYISKDLYVDFYDLLENDIDIKIEDFFPSVLSAMENKDGKIYAMWTGFGIETMVTPKQILDYNDGLSYNKIIELMDEYPNKIIHPCMQDSSKTLKWLINYNFNYFIDTKSGTCNFKDENMRKAIEIAANAPTSVPLDFDNKSTRFLDDKGLLCDMTLYSADDYAILRDGIFGGRYDINVIGMPAPDGKVINNLNGKGFEICINSESDNKNIAWEYVKTIIARKQNSHGFAVIESVFDIEANNTCERNKILIEKYGLDYSINTVDIGGARFNIKPVNIDDYTKIKDIIENSVSIEKFDNSIMNIVEEETMLYFTGEKSINEVMDIIQIRSEIYCSEIWG